MTEYQKDSQRFYQSLDDLDQRRVAAGKERRLTDLAARIDKPRSVVLKRRESLIRLAINFYRWPRLKAETWVDVIIGLAPRTDAEPA